MLQSACQWSRRLPLDAVLWHLSDQLVQCFVCAPAPTLSNPTILDHRWTGKKEQSSCFCIHILGLFCLYCISWNEWGREESMVACETGNIHTAFIACDIYILAVWSTQYCISLLLATVLLLTARWTNKQVVQLCISLSRPRYIYKLGLYYSSCFRLAFNLW